MIKIINVKQKTITKIKRKNAYTELNINYIFLVKNRGIYQYHERYLKFIMQVYNGQ